MPDNFAQLLEKASGTQVGLVQASHIASQIETLNKMYEDEGTRDVAQILATEWLERGSPLRQAAVRAWALEKAIFTGDKADPNAKAPKTNDLSDGIDAPDSGSHAAGAGAAANRPGETVGKDVKRPGHLHKPKGDIISKLRSLAARRRAPAEHAGHASTAAAYEAGMRDANAKHAHTAHRIGTLAARHAFDLGAEAGHRRGAAARQQTEGQSIALPVNAQAVVTQPGMVKSARVTELAKLAPKKKSKPMTFPQKAATYYGGAVLGSGVGMYAGFGLARHAGRLAQSATHLVAHVPDKAAVHFAGSADRALDHDDMKTAVRHLKVGNTFRKAGNGLLAAGNLARRALSGPSGHVRVVTGLAATGLGAGLYLAHRSIRRAENGEFSKSARVAELAKLSETYDATKHPKDDSGRFTANGGFRRKPSYLRAMGRGLLESVPGALLAYHGARNGRLGMVRLGTAAAWAGTLHGRYASFANQAREAGSKNPKKSGLKMAGASTAADTLLPLLGGALATHAVGFSKSDRVLTLAKLAGG